MAIRKAVVVGWFEIPVSDMERAIAFYESVFDTELTRNKMGVLDMAWFPYSEKGVGASGSLVQHDEFYQPSDSGSLLYFSSEDVDLELSRVEEAGGTILNPKTEISPDAGYMALFIDSEGNRIALHSRK
ncbi:MAG: VOC family protein [Bacteroidetes bacterium]|jgi:predicted enzyme related to lactoylglutathione lyase|nr:VOC family protein [Bacteroidota bacterium]